jgi:hypothetical protein
MASKRIAKCGCKVQRGYSQGSKGDPVESGWLVVDSNDSYIGDYWYLSDAIEGLQAWVQSDQHKDEEG